MEHLTGGQSFYENDPHNIWSGDLYNDREYQNLLEMITEQASAAYAVYQDVASQLAEPEQRRSFLKRPNFSRWKTEIVTEDAFTELLERKMTEWRSSGVMDYLVREFTEKGSRPNLVATPNKLASWEQIESLAGVISGGRVNTDQDFIKGYSSEELSGTLVDDPMRLSIIPSVYNMEIGTVEEQREQLIAMQATQPELGFRVPSVLEAVSCWYMLRHRELSASDFDRASFVTNMTYIRNFDLPLTKGRQLPHSYMTSDDFYYMGGDYDSNVRPGRLAVG